MNRNSRYSTTEEDLVSHGLRTLLFSFFL